MEQTCEDRIGAQLAGRIEDLNRMTDQISDAQAEERWDDAEEAQEELDAFPLSVDLKTTMVVQISTGGPGDQFEIEVVKGEYGWELADTHATYRFLDWFDGATRRTDDPAVLAYLESMVECLG